MQVCPLPRQPSVATILESFAAAKGVPHETVVGLQALFESMLGKMLLYSFERVQV